MSETVKEMYVFIDLKSIAFYIPTESPNWQQSISIHKLYVNYSSVCTNCLVQNTKVCRSGNGVEPE